MLLAWPARAMSAVIALFQPLQDIDIFVEDQNDEVFYTRLLTRLAGDKVRVARVFSKNGRNDVIAAAQAHDFSVRRALFIIDGDLEWVVGTPAPSIKGLFRLEAYCIENYLICKFASERLVVDELVVDQATAEQQLDFLAWIASVEQPLIKLFAAFGAVHVHHPASRTVSLGVTRLLSNHQLDPAKAESARVAAMAEAAKGGTKEAIEATELAAYQRAQRLATPLHIASGKAFLLPLLDLRFRRLGCAFRRASLRFRLSDHCELTGLAGLLQAMQQAARG